MIGPGRNGRTFYKYLTILFLTIIINIITSRFAVILWPIAPGVPALYFAVAFMIPFTLWFGVWGAIAAYAGCIIGAGLFAMPLTINLYWSLADLWQVLIPLLAFRYLQANVGLKTKRDLFAFFIFGWLLNNLAGAIWGSTMLAVGGIANWSDVLNTLVTWFVGNLIVIIVITPLLLRYVTRFIVRSGLFIEGYWFFKDPHEVKSVA